MHPPVLDARGVPIPPSVENAPTRERVAVAWARGVSFDYGRKYPDGDEVRKGSATITLQADGRWHARIVLVGTAEAVPDLIDEATLHTLLAGALWMKLRGIAAPL